MKDTVPKQQENDEVGWVEHAPLFRASGRSDTIVHNLVPILTGQNLATQKSTKLFMTQEHFILTEPTLLYTDRNYIHIFVN